MGGIQSRRQAGILTWEAGGSVPTSNLLAWGVTTSYSDALVHSGVSNKGHGAVGIPGAAHAGSRFLWVARELKRELCFPAFPTLKRILEEFL